LIQAEDDASQGLSPPELPIGLSSCTDVATRQAPLLELSHLPAY
jgi:hypothetical protein